jgi:hypothetical protein
VARFAYVTDLRTALWRLIASCLPPIGKGGPSPLAVSPANDPLRNLNQGEALPLEGGLLIYKYP